MVEYKEVRSTVDGLKDNLQLMISEYTKLNEAGNMLLFFFVLFVLLCKIV